MVLTFSITELSNLTGKTRPSIYKYLKAYEECHYDDLPFSFIQLFNLMSKNGVSRNEIIEYCENNFKKVDEDIKITEIVNLIKNNKDKINLDNLKKIVEEEISKMNDVVVNYNEKDLFIYFQQLRLLKAKELNDNNVTRTTKVEEEKTTIKGTFSNFGRFFERNVKNYKDTGTKIDKDIGVFNARNPVTLSLDTAQELVTSLFKDDKYGLAKLVFATSIILDIEYEYKYVEEGLQEVSQILYGDKDTLLKIKKSFEENYSSINSKPLNNDQIKALLVTGTVLGVMIAVAPFIAIVPVAVASVTAACLISENEKSIKEEFKESSPEKTASYLALQCTYIQKMRESLSEDEIKEELDALLRSVDSIKADLDYYLFVERESVKENKEKLKIFHRFDDRLIKVLNIEK